MSRINFDDLPLSSDQARAARNYFGLTQAKAADESGLPVHKIKRYEAGNYIPDIEFLQDLRAFFEKRGYRFEDTPEPGAKAKETGLVFRAGVVGDSGENQGGSRANRPLRTSFHHMRIALAEPEMGHVLDLIDANEEKAAALLQQPVETGFFGGPTEQTGARHAHALRLLAENGALFARLFGRAIGGTPSPEILTGKKKPATHAELLHHVQAAAHLAAVGDSDAKERHKLPPKPVESVAQALGLG